MCTKTVTVKESNGVIKKITFSNNCTLGTNFKDSCFVTVNGDIVIVNKIASDEYDSYNLICDYFLIKENVYYKPIESSKIGIYKVSCKQSKSVRLTDLQIKCVLMPTFTEDESYICVPFVSMTTHH